MAKMRSQKATLARIRRDKLMNQPIDAGYLAQHGQTIAFRILFYALVIGLCFSILYPLIKILPVVFSDFSMLGNPDAIWIPLKFSAQSFSAAIRFGFGNGTTMIQTLVYCLSITVIEIIISAMAGYTLGRVAFPGRSIVMGLLILCIVVPPQSLLISQYLRFKSFDVFGIFNMLTGAPLDLINQPYTLFLLAVFGFGVRQSIFVFIFRQFFRGLPMELEEAALIDGCGFYRMFARIALPNAMPAIMTVAVLCFVWNYGDTYYTGYFHPDGPYLAGTLSSTFASQNMEAILNGIQRFFGVASTNSMIFDAVKYAAGLLYMAPLLLIYFLAQKKLVENLERSGIVG